MVKVNCKLLQRMLRKVMAKNGGDAFVSTSQILRFLNRVPNASKACLALCQIK